MNSGKTLPLLGKTLPLFVFLFAAVSVFANNFHTNISENEIELNGEKQINSNSYKTVKLNLDALVNFLQSAPKEFSGEFLTLALPNYKGETVHFKITESKIMQDGLAAKYPNFKTYNGQGIEDATANLKLDITHKGVHAYIRDLSGTWAIDPYHNNTTEYYLVHHKNGFVTDKYGKYACGLTEHTSEEKQFELRQTFNNDFAKQLQMPECALRTYRVAINATGEFTSFHGGTVADGLAAVVTSLNRINGVYERDNGLRMILVDNNDLVIYTNAGTDPFTNGNAGTMIVESHDNLVAIIGSENFDIGHVYSNAGAGLAGLSVACNNNNKGRGVTGVNPPIGDFYDIDYASHEFGHQFSGNHTWDFCGGSGNGGTATMEPGSASTIMGYADLCGANNLQNFSDDYFHSYSILEITNFTQLGNGNNCPIIIPNDNNAPTANAGNDYIIPMGTPFELTGNATDPDGDVLTFCWEQFDTGDGNPVNNAASNNAIFRTWLPTIDNYRIFPRLQELLNNTTIFGETLPMFDGIMNFRLTVRDNFAGSGCTDFDDMTVDVTANAGPFVVNSPNGGEAVNAFSIQQINWDVANTNQAPINCNEVDILLSVDGGLTFPIVLANNIANTGTYNLTIPDEQTTTARIKIVCSDNIFFDISNDEFSIIEPLAPSFIFGEFNGINDSICAGEDIVFDLSILQILGFSGNVSFVNNNLPAAVNLNYSNNSAVIPSTLTATISATENFTNGTNNFEIIGTSGLVSDTIQVSIFVESGAPIPTFLSLPPNNEIDVITGTLLEWNANATATNGYEIEIAIDEDFNYILESNFTIENNYTPTIAVANGTTYFWRVKATNNCGLASTWSPLFKFSTSNCNFLDANQLTSITFGSQNSTINYTTPGSIQTVEVFNLDIDHTRIGNCEINLTSPAGTTITLFDNECGNDNDMLLNFADAGQNYNLIPCPPTDNGIYQPAAGDFANFIGQSAIGDWVLNIDDNQNQGNGELNAWELKICTEQVGPNILIFSEETEICAGESISLTAFGGESYIWFPSSSLSSANDSIVTATPTETTTYTLAGTDATGTNQTEITIVVNDLPTAEITNLPDSVFNDNTINLIGNPPGGVFTGPGISGNDLEPFYSNSGIVEINYTVTDNEGCSTTTTEQIYIGIVTDIIENTIEEEFTILQNNENILLNVSQEQTLNVEMFNLNGAIVNKYNKYFSAGIYNIETKNLNLPKGVYVLKVNNNNKQQILKFYQL